MRQVIPNRQQARCFLQPQKLHFQCEKRPFLAKIHVFDNNFARRKDTDNTTTASDSANDLQSGMMCLLRGKRQQNPNLSFAEKGQRVHSIELHHVKERTILHLVHLVSRKNRVGSIGLSKHICV